MECVISIDELTRRPARRPNLEAQTRVLLHLADTMARAPGQLLQELVENLLELCNAGSTGISLLDPPTEAAEPCFRWVATAGRFQQYAGHTMPRFFSPCGLVIDANQMMLMAHPARHFPHMEALSESVNEVLLFPFHRDGVAVGTIWVASHDDERHFDQEDVRLVRDLARFAAAAVGFLSDAAANARSEADARATLGHELRNAIGPLANAVTVLQKSTDPEVLRHAVEIMERQTIHLRRLVEDELDSSRVSTGKLRVETASVNLNAVVSQAVEMVTERIVQSGQTVELHLYASPLMVEGDNERLNQVFTNLLNNAAKYGRPGCPVTTIVRSDDECAIVSIQDQGIGIDLQMLPRIFDLFVQTDRSLRRAQGGLGIGLAIVKQLVQLHGGRVEARSAGPGRGSEFIVHLPLTV